MAKHKEISIHEMTAQDLKSKIDAARIELQRLKFTHAVTPIPNPNEIKSAKKQIARYLTELRIKELKNA